VAAVAGKKGRSGRPRGSLSWSKNPTAVAGHHLNVLMDAWLAGVQIPIDPRRSLVQPAERRYTVPVKIKRVLAEIAIVHTLGTEWKRPGVTAVMEWARRHAPTHTLRRSRRRQAP